MKNERKEILSTMKGVTIYKREGKFYWTIKSGAFDSEKDAAKNASKHFPFFTVRKIK